MYHLYHVSKHGHVEVWSNHNHRWSFPPSSSGKTNKDPRPNAPHYTRREQRKKGGRLVWMVRSVPAVAPVSGPRFPVKNHDRVRPDTTSAGNQQHGRNLFSRIDTSYTCCFKEFMETSIVSNYTTEIIRMKLVQSSKTSKIRWSR